MTRDEAIKELAELEPKEAQAWRDYKSVGDKHFEAMARLEAERGRIRDALESETHEALWRWLPIHKRKKELKSFLEISG